MPINEKHVSTWFGNKSLCNFEQIKQVRLLCATTVGLEIFKYPVPQVSHSHCRRFTVYETILGLRSRRFTVYEIMTSITCTVSLEGRQNWEDDHLTTVTNYISILVYISISFLLHQADTQTQYLSWDSKLTNKLTHRFWVFPYCWEIRDMTQTLNSVWTPLQASNSRISQENESISQSENTLYTRSRLLRDKSVSGQIRHQEL